VLLYVLGSLTVRDKNAVAMVGSRMTTHYGIEMARKIAYQLAYTGVTVVSGGARGIDTAAAPGRPQREGAHHRGAGDGDQSGFPGGERRSFSGASRRQGR
jgi:DNA processing protein